MFFSWFYLVFLSLSLLLQNRDEFEQFFQRLSICTFVASFSYLLHAILGVVPSNSNSEEIDDISPLKDAEIGRKLVKMTFPHSNCIADSSIHLPFPSSSLVTSSEESLRVASIQSVRSYLAQFCSRKDEISCSSELTSFSEKIVDAVLGSFFEDHSLKPKNLHPDIRSVCSSVFEETDLVRLRSLSLQNKFRMSSSELWEGQLKRRIRAEWEWE